MSAPPVRTALALAAAAALAVLVACASRPSRAPIPAGAGFVAMGSSFAAGPGIPAYVDDPAAPCYRSDQNYARQVARRRGLALVDVSCSGATTKHLDGPRDAIPPQLDALTPDTRLVTVTIGGNDLNYIGRLVTASCLGLAAETGGATTDCRPVPPAPTEQDYADTAARMDAVAKEIRRRSPAARLVFVDYLAVLPASGVCAATPLSAAEADADREIARRLAAITARVAADNGAEAIRASSLSVGHDACSGDPWMHGYPRPGAPVSGASYHPNAAGMTAIADALEALVSN
jgi:lysophospholipase L1-like esterase